MQLFTDRTSQQSGEKVFKKYSHPHQRHRKVCVWFRAQNKNLPPSRDETAKMMDIFLFHCYRLPTIHWAIFRTENKPQPTLAPGACGRYFIFRPTEAHFLGLYVANARTNRVNKNTHEYRAVGKILVYAWRRTSPYACTP